MSLPEGPAPRAACEPAMAEDVERFAKHAWVRSASSWGDPSLATTVSYRTPGGLPLWKQTDPNFDRRARDLDKETEVRVCDLVHRRALAREATALALAYRTLRALARPSETIKPTDTTPALSPTVAAAMIEAGLRALDIETPDDLGPAPFTPEEYERWGMSL